MGDERPFLPDPNPEAVVPPPTRKKGKGSLLWGLLILAFLVIWSVFSDDGNSARVDVGAKAAEACRPSPWFWLAQVGVPVLLVAGLMTWFVRLFGEFRRFHVTQEPGLFALSEGRFIDAYSSFKSTEKAVLKKPGYRTAVQLNIAESLLWSGKIQEALDTFISIEKTKVLRFLAQGRVHACSNLAVVYAILGDTSTAEQWAHETRKRLAKSGDVRYLAAAILCWAEALILCRQGQYEACLVLLDKERDHLRGWLTFRTTQAANLLRLFAAVRSGRSIETAIRQSCVRPGMRALSEAKVLFAPWPEMVEFLGTCPNEVEE